MTRQGGWPATGFGGQLRQVREEAGLTQQQLGERAGCHTMTIAKLEAGTQEPAWPLVLALAKALGVSTEAFRGRVDGPAPAAPKRGQPPKPGRAAPLLAESLEAAAASPLGKRSRGQGKPKKK
jgi:transcriptional regulator with XRE-family HTH domain